MCFVCLSWFVVFYLCDDLYVCGMVRFPPVEKQVLCGAVSVEFAGWVLKGPPEDSLQRSQTVAERDPLFPIARLQRAFVSIWVEADKMGWQPECLADVHHTSTFTELFAGIVLVFIDFHNHRVGSAVPPEIGPFCTTLSAFTRWKTLIVSVVRAETVLVKKGLHCSLLGETGTLEVVRVTHVTLLVGSQHIRQVTGHALALHQIDFVVFLVLFAVLGHTANTKESKLGASSMLTLLVGPGNHVNKRVSRAAGGTVPG